MNRSTKFTLAAVAVLGLAVVAVPVVAQQTQMHWRDDGWRNGYDGRT